MKTEPKTQTKAKHQPVIAKPPRVGKLYECPVCCAKAWDIEDGHEGPCALGIASFNANLYNAAPDLLAALERLLAYTEGFTQCSAGKMDAKSAARAAIARAKGQQ